MGNGERRTAHMEGDEDEGKEKQIKEGKEEKTRHPNGERGQWCMWWREGFGGREGGLGIWVERNEVKYRQLCIFPFFHSEPGSKSYISDGWTLHNASPCHHFRLGQEALFYIV